MAQRLVTWNLLDLTGSVYTGNVRFLFTGSYTSGSQYVKTDISVLSDANGDGSTELFVNEEGDLRHRVDVPVSLLIEPPPFVSSRLIVGVVRDPVTEVQRVVVFRTNLVGR